MSMTKHYCPDECEYGKLKAEIERLLAVLKEIADDPTGISFHQADIAKAVLARLEQAAKEGK